MKQDTSLINESLGYPVYAGLEIWREISDFVRPFRDSGGIFILADQNTRKYCLPVLIDNLDELESSPVFSIPPGEQSKNLSSLARIWKWLMEQGALKDSLLVCLGGGIVGDVGGFAAATFKRGIRYVNIPTSLIAQADAAIGGKVGINVSGIKNQAGLFYDPSAVFINPSFLVTLPVQHLGSGFAEIIKSAALSGNGFWEEIKNATSLQQVDLFRLITESVNFKCQVVAGDPFDNSSRKVLNFGHTIGHALESYYNEPGRDGMLHGEAVAAGMICESYLSREISGLPEKDLDEISNVIRTFFELKPLDSCLSIEYLKMMDHDKKRTKSGPVFSLLKRLGQPVIEDSIRHEDIIRSFGYFNDEFTK